MEQSVALKEVAEELVVSKSEPDHSVNVSIEPNHECEVIEIRYDGQEIYKEYVIIRICWHNWHFLLTIFI